MKQTDKICWHTYSNYAHRLSNVETNIMLQASQYGTAVFQAL